MRSPILALVATCAAVGLLTACETRECSYYNECGPGAYCSVLTANGDQSDHLCESEITPGSTPVAITLDASALNKRAIYFECTVPAGVEWAAGTWHVRLNITTAQSDCSLFSIHICRVNSSCVSQASIGSVTSGAQKRSSSNPVMMRPAKIDRPNRLMTTAVCSPEKPCALSICGMCTSAPP